MQEESFKIFHEHPHYSTEEVFIPPTKMIRGFIEKNYNKGLHSQAFYEINIILNGSANHYIGKRKITVSCGDTFIIPPDVMHGYDGNKGFDVYHLLINPKYLERNFAELQLLPAFSSLFRVDPIMREKATTKFHFCLTNSEIMCLMPHLNNLIEYSKENDAISHIIANSEALIIIARLCAIYENHEEQNTSFTNEDSAFYASLSYLYENYNSKLSIEKLSHTAHMSRTAYIEKFKRITGQPPAKFIKQHRFEVAIQLLNETSMTEAEIASAVGFSDTSHLVKVFIAKTGKTPSAFRRGTIPCD